MAANLLTAAKNCAESHRLNGELRTAETIFDLLRHIERFDDVVRAARQIHPKCQGADELRRAIAKICDTPHSTPPEKG